MSVMMQNKRHSYVQDALALNGLEAGRSCFDDFQHQKALRPLADGLKTALALHVNLGVKTTPQTGALRAEMCLLSFLYAISFHFGRVVNSPRSRPSNMPTLANEV